MAFVTGHERDDRDDSKVEWSKLSTAVGTLVFFMGVRNLPEICRRLTENGRPPTTPVAVIRWGTLPEQQTVTGALDDIVDKVRSARLKPPAVIIVGDVVRLREQLNWFEQRPLFGRTILVTRAREQAGDFKSRLEELGARLHRNFRPSTSSLPLPGSRWIMPSGALKSTIGWSSRV